MRIFFPIRAFYPAQVGGPSNTLYWHTCALKEKGVDVNIVTTTWGIAAGMVVENQKIAEACGDVYYGRGSASSLAIIKKAIYELKDADIIHLNSLFHGLSFVCFFVGKFFYPHKKIVWSVRGELSPHALRFGSRNKRLLLWLYGKFNKDVLFHATSLQEIQDIQAQFPKVKTVEVPNFLQATDRLSLDTKKQFLFMGRIHPIKALDKLIKGVAMSRLFVYESYRLIIIGTHTADNQAHVDYLQQLVHDLGIVEHVEFRGHVIGEDKETAYAESFALVLPSESENFGNVCIEAMNHGTPVIAAKGTPWAILEEYQAGYHIENAPAAIAEALDKMIALDKEEYVRMRENAVRLVDEKFSIRSKIGSWMDIYLSLLNKD